LATWAASASATTTLAALGDEVGLAVQLDQDTLVAVLQQGDHSAVAGVAALTLGNALLALDAEQLDGVLDVAVRLVQGLLAVHHSGAGQLTELLDVSGGEVRHCSSVSSRDVGGGWSAGPRPRG
jgi:hypothetical protein